MTRIFWQKYTSTKNFQSKVFLVFKRGERSSMKSLPVIPHWFAFMKHEPSWPVLRDAKEYHRDGALCHTTAINDSWTTNWGRAGCVSCRILMQDLSHTLCRRGWINTAINKTTKPLEFVWTLTPLFSGSGLCPWGRGGVFSLQEVVKLAQVQGHVTTVSAVAWLIMQNNHKTVSWGHPAELEQCVREPTTQLWTFSCTSLN